MSWHYSNEGKQVGPISEAEFEASVKAGAINRDTLVWREGLSQWTPYGELSQSGGVAVGTAARCAECGREYAEDEMANFGGAWVCAGCKSQYVQKIKEGVNVSGNFAYAGFWIRFLAKFLDGILLGIVGAVLGALVGFVGAATKMNPRATMLIITALSWAIRLGYNVFFLGKYGATLGKMAVKIKVVRADGEPVSYGRAFGRSLAAILSYITLFIGFMMAGWDEEKRALHDRICDTRVVKG